MPAGIPVATVAVGGARNAGLLAVRILAAADDDLRAQMIEFQARLTAQAKAKGAALREKLLSSGETTPYPRCRPACPDHKKRDRIRPATGDGDLRGDPFPRGRPGTPPVPRR